LPYVKPVLQNRSLQFHANTQYSLLFTPEGCPSLPDGVIVEAFGSTILQLSENAMLFCVMQAISFDSFKTDTEANPLNAVITCSNLEGEYSVNLNVASATLGGTSCGEGFYAVTVPYIISPELPGDCIVNTYVQGSPQDNCHQA
jgi:hypothetical protein